MRGRSRLVWCLTIKQGVCLMSDLNNNIVNTNNKDLIKGVEEAPTGGTRSPQTGGSVERSLGNTGVNVSKLTKWQLLSRVQAMLAGTDYGVLRCQKTLGQVQIIKGSKGSWFAGVVSCKNIWLCPVCNLRISAERGDMIRQTQEKGFYMAMLTLTLQHNQGDELDDIFGALKSAVRDLKTGGVWARLKKEFQIVAYVTAYEITYGQNGWHPHVHIILYFDGVPDRDDLFQKLTDRWLHVVEKVGRYASSDHGLNLSKTDAEQGADYITKFRSNLAYEMTGTYNKGKTFWELVQQGKRKLVLEYAHATYRLKTLTWSHHAKKILGIKKTDVKDDDENIEVLANIGDNLWRVIRSRCLQGFILELAEIDQDGLHRYLGQLCSDYENEV